MKRVLSFWWSDLNDIEMLRFKPGEKVLSGSVLAEQKYRVTVINESMKLAKLKSEEVDRLRISIPLKVEKGTRLIRGGFGVASLYASMEGELVKLDEFGGLWYRQQMDEVIYIQSPVGGEVVLDKDRGLGVKYEAMEINCIVENILIDKWCEGVVKCIDQNDLSWRIANKMVIVDNNIDKLMVAKMEAVGVGAVLFFDECPQTDDLVRIKIPKNEMANLLAVDGISSKKVFLDVANSRLLVVT